jgi:hypothetical protein
MTTPRRGGRAVECTGLENRRAGITRLRGFESLPLRSRQPNLALQRAFRGPSEPLRLENPTTIVRGDRVTHLVYDVSR